MSMSNFKSSITNIPTYLDGYLKVYKRKNISTSDFPEYAYVSTGHIYAYESLSIFDKLRFEAHQQDIELTHKIRIPQSKEIDSECVIEMEDGFHEIFNIAHFRNKEGYMQSDITLKKYEKELDIRDD